MVELSLTGGKNIFRTFWQIDNGCMPACHYYLDLNQGDAFFRETAFAQWERSGNVYYPKKYYVSMNKNKDENDYVWQWAARKAEVNVPVEEKFDWSIIGLEECDIIVDEINQIVNIVKDGKPVYLAKFYEKYQTPEERVMSRYRLMLMEIGVILIVLGLFFRDLRKRKENN